MKNSLIYFIFLILVSCHNSTTTIKKDYNNNSKTETITSTSNWINDKLTVNFSSTNTDENGEISTFNCDGIADIEDSATISLNLNFKNADDQIKDSLGTENFSKFIDLKSVEKLKIDSFKYIVKDKEIDLRFIMFFSRKNDGDTDKKYKYHLKYLSNFKNPKPVFSVSSYSITENLN